ncbi:MULTISPECIES: hypothetical protein [unclassified Bartonella]|uniref:hypothetical protein n=2 Tax=Bartonella TaxID=773 RepID=UPI0035CE944F
MKKYELTDETINVDGFTLHRIRALRDFGGVKKGNLGGFIEDEDNLSHEADCWVNNEAMVYCGAEVYDSAKVFGNAKVAYFARVYGNAQVYDNAKVYGGDIFGDAQIYKYAIIDGNPRIYGDAQIYADYKIVYKEKTENLTGDDVPF